MRAVLALIIIGSGLGLVWLDYTNHIGLGSTPLVSSGPTLAPPPAPDQPARGADTGTGTGTGSAIASIGVHTAGNGGGVQLL